MTIRLKIATVVTVLTNLYQLQLLSLLPRKVHLVAAVLMQHLFFHLAKMHLMEATKDIKMGNSQAALAQLNMTRQGLTSAEVRLNVSIMQ